MERPPWLTSRSPSATRPRAPCPAHAPVAPGQPSTTSSGAAAGVAAEFAAAVVSGAVVAGRRGFHRRCDHAIAATAAAGRRCDHCSGRRRRPARRGRVPPGAQARPPPSPECCSVHPEVSGGDGVGFSRSRMAIASSRRGSSAARELRRPARRRRAPHRAESVSAVTGRRVLEPASFQGRRSEGAGGHRAGASATAAMGKASGLALSRPIHTAWRSATPRLFAAVAPCRRTR